MLGPTGAFACFAAGTGAGLLLRSRCHYRLQSLEAWQEALQAMGLLLREERLPLGELLHQAAQGLPGHAAAAQVRGRLLEAGKAIQAAPSLTLAQAYFAARQAHPMAGEQSEEKDLLALLFRQLGSGSAAMRLQAVTGANRRLEPLAQKAKTKAEQTGKLYAQLGALGGLMLGIALW